MKNSSKCSFISMMKMVQTLSVRMKWSDSLGKYWVRHLKLARKLAVKLRNMKELILCKTLWPRLKQKTFIGWKMKKLKKI